MKKVIFIVATILFLQSCSTILPSFWDDNQSAVIINVRQQVVNLDCEQPHLPQVAQIKNSIEWVELYSQSKKRQHDVLRLIEPLKETTAEFYTRSQTQQGSKVYCESKKTIMDAQSKMAADAMLRRF